MVPQPRRVPGSLQPGRVRLSPVPGAPGGAGRWRCCAALQRPRGPGRDGTNRDGMNRDEPGRDEPAGVG